MVYVAEAHQVGRGVKVDLETSTQWYRRAAEKGNCRAQFSMSVAYREGRGVTKDLPTAKEWNNRADANTNCDTDTRGKVDQMKVWFRYYKI